MLISQGHFDGPPLELMGPLLGPLKPTAFLKSMGPLNSMGPWIIVPPAPPPLSVPLATVPLYRGKIAEPSTVAQLYLVPDDHFE